MAAVRALGGVADQRLAVDKDGETRAVMKHGKSEEIVVSRFFPVIYFSFPVWERREGRIRAPQLHRLLRRRSLLEEKQ